MRLLPLQSQRLILVYTPLLQLKFLQQQLWIKEKKEKER